MRVNACKNIVQPGIHVIPFMYFKIAQDFLRSGPKSLADSSLKQTGAPLRNNEWWLLPNTLLSYTIKYFRASGG